MDNLQMYKKMYRIRLFEETLLTLFSQNKLSGTTHTSIGQEAVAVASMNAIQDDDYVFSNHRCHGHFIAYSDNINVLLAEIMGKSTGMCKGRGGSQHVYYKNFYSNGVQGGIAPNAVGVSFAEKLRNTNNLALVFLGDGTLGQGIVYESLNISSLYDIPILFVVENNRYAMSTKVEEAVAGSIRGRFDAFGITCDETDSDDTNELCDIFNKAVGFVRHNKRPFCQIVNTYRLSPHSKGDEVRDSDEISYWKQRDPLAKLRSKCVSNDVEIIERQIVDEMRVAIEFAENSDIEKLNFSNNFTINKKTNRQITEVREEKLLVTLREGLVEVFDKNNNLVLLGEDVCDPYGGAFKVTSGLSTKYPERIYNTPISESALAGIGVGLALNGMIPIVEIMFGDFLTLCFDQILNHAAKYRSMYAEQKNVPIIIRTPMGGGRGYGPTHSQSIEKFFLGIPDVTVIAISLIHDANELLKRIVDHISSPVILIEDKKSYGLKTLAVNNGKYRDFTVIEENEALFPIIKLSLVADEKADVALITYGSMLPLALEVAEQLMLEEEIVVDVLLNTSISPLNISGLSEFITCVSAVVTLEEGTRSFGWGAEVVSSLSSSFPDKKYDRVGAIDYILPCSTVLESQVLPQKIDLISAVRGCLE